MADAFLLEWTFTPPDYFEERVEIARPDCSIVIDSGRAEARVPPEHYPDDHSFRNYLHEELNARFLAAQVLCHKPYTLSKPTLHRVHPDGRIDAWVFTEPATMTFTGGITDFITRDSAGNVVSDTRRERIDKRKDLAERAAAHATTDDTANAILRSYSAAVYDPANELVHLYEIREALARRFANEATAIATLSLSSTRWSRLGRLANDEPLKQGRHRGRQAGALRDATKEELSEAREIARSMVESYLRYLG
jgi:hypothetical protein